MKAFLAAIRFLTILPTGSAPDRREDLAWAPRYFWAVGIVIGLIAAVADSLFVQLLPSAPASVLTVALLAGLSGGLHLDGLADTADAWFSGKDRDGMLAIMKDSRSGPMGVAALILALVFKVSLLAALPESVRAVTILSMAVCGRAGICIVMGLESPARPGGIADVFAESADGTLAIVAAVAALVVALVSVEDALITGALAALACAWLCSRACRRKFGGYTGDTLGATCELCEILPAVFILMAHRGIA